MKQQTIETTYDAINETMSIFKERKAEIIEGIKEELRLIDKIGEKMERERQIDRNIEIATIIKEQLGHKALYMLGAMNFVAIENGLQFRIRGSKLANSIRIVLDPDDTYRMQFFKIIGLRSKTVKDIDGIYCDQLHEIIRNTTGLATSLF